MCRKNSGAAFITGALFRHDAVAWTQGEPSFYQSSEKAKRGFCSRCGSWLSWHLLEVRVMMTIGSFDHPDDIRPEFHSMTESQLSWLELDDGLPRHARFPPVAQDAEQGL
jgi:hypothetical protein